MKKVLLMLTVAIGLFSCSTKSSESQTDVTLVAEDVKDPVE